MDRFARTVNVRVFGSLPGHRMLGIEKFPHAQFDAIGKLAGDDDDWFLRFGHVRSRVPPGVRSVFR